MFEQDTVGLMADARPYFFHILGLVGWKPFVGLHTLACMRAF